MNRIDGRENLYVGSIWGLHSLAKEPRNITHIVSVLHFEPGGTRQRKKPSFWDEHGKNYEHLIIDVDDLDETDLLVHFPRAVKFIEKGLYPDSEAIQSDATTEQEGTEKAVASDEKADGDEKATDKQVDGHEKAENEDDAITPVPKFAKLKLRPASERKDPGAPTGSVLVHCAVGKSRSVSVVVAYLLWKYPNRFGQPRNTFKDAKEKKRGAVEAVGKAIEWVRRSRSIAEPNYGFHKQLAMWWEMGCPDEVEPHPIYRRWRYQAIARESINSGEAPTTLHFEDDEDMLAARDPDDSDDDNPQVEIRCKRCRRVLATPPFIISSNHQNPFSKKGYNPDMSCQHYFIEPLSWMRPILELGELEGRLTCPNAKCGAVVGRYSWKGFECNCSEWVLPAFSLQKSKVDEAHANRRLDARSTLGIRTPPTAPATQNSLSSTASLNS